MRPAAMRLVSFAIMAAVLTAGCAAGATAAPTHLAERAEPLASAASPTAGVSEANVESTAGPASCDPALQFTCVVDKAHGLGPAYAPDDLVRIDERWTVPGYGAQQLRQDAARDLEAMLEAAAREGMQLRVRSSYRSYDEQVATFAAQVARRGEAEASRRSAPPGHSEHQLGTTADITSASAGWALSARFAETAEGRWLHTRMHEYGFALSYPAGAEAVTGYIYEPWHIRYVGLPAAQRWYESGEVLVRFLELLAGTP